jgi:hydroxyacylglutathione hydrolase
MAAKVDLLIDDTLRRITNGDFHSNTYLVQTSKSKCVVIDPGLDRMAIERGFAECNWQPEAVLCTHGHFDHVGGAAWLQQSHQVPVYLPAADLKLAKQSNFLMAAFKLNKTIELPDFQLISDTQVSIEFGERTFDFHALPGHTPGSTGIVESDLLFSGDTLYARKMSLSSMRGENHVMLRESLAKLFSWIGGHIRVFPGHGGSATIDEIHLHNEALRVFMAESTL